MSDHSAAQEGFDLLEFLEAQAMLEAILSIEGVVQAFLSEDLV